MVCVVLQGRYGKGALFVFAAGTAGNKFVTNHVVIAVNNIGKEGVIPTDGFLNSATLVSAFGYGSRHSEHIVCSLTLFLLLTTTNQT